MMILLKSFGHGLGNVPDSERFRKDLKDLGIVFSEPQLADMKILHKSFEQRLRNLLESERFQIELFRKNLEDLGIVFSKPQLADIKAQVTRPEKGEKTPYLTF